jgi:hypothetical protein
MTGKRAASSLVVTVMPSSCALIPLIPETGVVFFPHEAVADATAARRFLFSDAAAAEDLPSIVFLLLFVVASAIVVEIAVVVFLADDIIIAIAFSVGRNIRGRRDSADLRCRPPQSNGRSTSSFVLSFASFFLFFLTDAAAYSSSVASSPPFSFFASSSFVFFFLFFLTDEAAYIAEKEYPSRIPPLHP